MSTKWTMLSFLVLAATVFHPAADAALTSHHVCFLRPNENAMHNGPLLVRRETLLEKLKRHTPTLGFLKKNEPKPTHIRAPKFRKYVADNYEMGSLIGEGGSSVVYHAIDKSGKDVAVKFVPISMRDTNVFKVEEKALAMTKGARNVIEAYYTQRDYRSKDKKLWDIVVLQFADAGNLANEVVPRVGYTNWKAVRVWFSDMVYGVYELHLRKIIHADIKLENMYLTRDPVLNRRRVLIADLGLAKFDHDGSAGKQLLTLACGTREYIAPELRNPMLFAHPFDPYKVDVFSLGVALFGLLVGEFVPRVRAFGPIDWKAYAFLEEHALPNKGVDPSLLPGLKELLRGMLASKNSDRWTLDQVWKHPYVQGAERFDNRKWDGGPDIPSTPSWKSQKDPRIEQLAQLVQTNKPKGEAWNSFPLIATTGPVGLPSS